MSLRVTLIFLAGTLCRFFFPRRAYPTVSLHPTSDHCRAGKWDGPNRRKAGPFSMGPSDLLPPPFVSSHR